MTVNKAHSNGVIIEYGEKQREILDLQGKTSCS